MSSYEEKVYSLIYDYHDDMDSNLLAYDLLGFLFLKYLSEKLLKTLNNTLQTYEMTYEEAYDDQKIREELKKEAIEKIGYFIQPKLLFSNMVIGIITKENVITLLNEAFQEIQDSSINTPSENAFKDIFEDMNFSAPYFGDNENQIKANISKILLDMTVYGMEDENMDDDSIANAFDMILHYLSKYFQRELSYYPTSPSLVSLLSKILSNKKEIERIYDPVCGTGELLKESSRKTKISHIYGQEENKAIYNLARMNLLIHGFEYNQIDIRLGNSLENPDENHKNLKFDAIISSPPFSAKWAGDDSLLKDPRFSDYDTLAPKNKADYAYIQHMLYHLDQEGTMAVLVPPGVLFREGAEANIREHIITKQNCLDAVIGLPSHLTYSASIPTCILIFKKSRENKDNILFIDASAQYKNHHYRKIMMPSQIHKIVKTYNERKEEENYSHLATIEEIQKNNYNLNINKYVETSQNNIDLSEIRAELARTEKELKEVNDEIIECCKKVMDFDDMRLVLKLLK